MKNQSVRQQNRRDAGVDYKGSRAAIHGETSPCDGVMPTVAQNNRGQGMHNRDNKVAFIGFLIGAPLDLNFDGCYGRELPPLSLPSAGFSGDGLRASLEIGLAFLFHHAALQ